MTKSLIERFEKKYFIEPNSGCWLWTGTLQSGGYGLMWAGKGEGQYVLAHRVSYETYVGPIPEGLHIDHLCRTRACVNPRHLEPVTCGENTRRGNAIEATKKRFQEMTHCKNGHEFTPENTRMALDSKNHPYRACKASARENMRVYRARVRQC